MKITRNDRGDVIGFVCRGSLNQKGNAQLVGEIMRLPSKGQGQKIVLDLQIDTLNL